MSALCNIADSRSNYRLTINRNSVLYFSSAKIEREARDQKGLRPLTSSVKTAVAYKLANVVMALGVCILAPMQNVVAKGQIQNLSSPSEIIEEKVGTKVFLVSHLVVKARPEQVWQVLSDYDNASHVFPNLKKCQLLQDKGQVKIVAHEVCPSGVPGSFRYVLAVKETAPRQLEWHRLSGDFKDVDGIWKLDPIEGGRSTYVTYSSYVNGGLFLPQALIRRQFRIDIPGVMAALKSQAEATTQIARRPEASRNN